MNLLLRVDRESFDALKTLLRRESATSASRDEPPSGRMQREALKRVFDKIRDMNYSDYVLPVSLDYE